MSRHRRSSRRRFLRTAGAVALGGFLAGCGGSSGPGVDGTPTPTTDRPSNRSGGPSTPPVDVESTFERTVDVTEYGAQPGGAPVNDAIERAASPGTLVRFPGGTYRLDGPITLPDGPVGLFGSGSRLVLPDGHRGPFVVADGTDSPLLAGFVVDMRGDRSGHVRFRCPTRFLVEDVRYLGRGGLTGYAFDVAVTEADGRGVLRGVRVPRGGYMDRYDDGDGNAGDGRIGVWTGIDHVGTLRVENCDIREFGNNGLYTSRCPGDVQVVDSYFENNNVASIRISGAGSYAENCTVVVDHSRYEPQLTSTERGFNTRAIMVEQAKGMTSDRFPAKEPGAEVRDCRLTVSSTYRMQPLQSVIEQGPQARTLTVKDTTVRVDVSDTPAIRRGRPGAVAWRRDRRMVPPPHWTKLENVTVSGSAAGGAAVVLDRAPGSVVRDCTITQQGANRDGIRVVDTTDVLIDGGQVRTTGFPVSLQIRPSRLRGGCVFSVGELPDVESTGIAGDAVRVIEALSEDGVASAGDSAGEAENATGSSASSAGRGANAVCLWGGDELTVRTDDRVDVGIVAIEPDTSSGVRVRGQIRGVARTQGQG